MRSICIIRPYMVEGTTVPGGNQQPCKGDHYHMIHITGKPVFGVCNQVDANRPAQPQNQGIGLIFWIYKLEVLYYLGSEKQRR